MKSTRSNPVIVPNSQQSEHASRKLAMNGQMRPYHAMPIFNRTTGSDGLIPGAEHVGGICSPSQWNALQQFFAGWTKHGSSQPCPRQQSQRLGPQDARSMLLHRIKLPGKQQGLRQSQAELFGEHLDLALQDRYGQWRH